MACIRARKRADGTWAYTVQIRIHEKKDVIYEEAKTFSRQAAAEKWARARRVALEDPATLAQARAGTDPASIPRTSDLCGFQAALEVSR